MFQALFTIIMNLAGTMVQLVCLPINAIVVRLLPDLSTQISSVSSQISTIFSGMGWAVGFLPATVVSALLFVVACEIAKHSIYIETHTLIKVWGVLQKIKFW